MIKLFLVEIIKKKGQERMLKMIDVKLIKDLKEAKGKSLREIARITNYNFRTVKKYVEMEDFSKDPEVKKITPTKLASYYSDINSWLETDKAHSKKQSHTAKRIHERLQEEYGDKYTVSYSLLANYVSKKKKAINNSQAYLPLTHEPGSAQVDFGSAEYYANEVLKKCKYLILTFPHSNHYYYQIFKGENQECFLTGLQNIFHHIKGVPHRIMFDNLSAAVNMRKHVRTKNDKFLKFEMHYGFEAVFCNPNAGNEKGNVENKVGYHRRNFMVPVPAIENLSVHNKNAFAVTEKEFDKIHYSKDKSIGSLFKEDQNAFKALPVNSFGIYKIKKVKCNKYGMVQIDTKQYSAAPKYAQQEVWLYIYHDKIQIKDEDHHLITEHERLYGAEKKSMNWLPYLDLIQKRPKALRYTDFFDTLPANWQQIFNESKPPQQREYMQVLSAILIESGSSFAEKVLDETIKYGVSDFNSIETTFKRLKNEPVSIEKYEPQNMPELPKYTPEFESYNTLMRRY